MIKLVSSFQYAVALLRLKLAVGSFSTVAGRVSSVQYAIAMLWLKYAVGSFSTAACKVGSLQYAVGSSTVAGTVGSVQYVESSEHCCEKKSNYKFKNLSSYLSSLSTKMGNYLSVGSLQYAVGSSIVAGTVGSEHCCERKSNYNLKNFITNLTSLSTKKLNCVPPTASIRKVTQLPTAYCLLQISTKILNCILPTVILLTACSKEEAVPITADFSIQVVDNDYSVPVQVKITNNTEGADMYNWFFIGASPTSSDIKNPGTITYTEPGNYTIKLEASNQDGISESKEIVVPIDAAIVIGFTTEILVDNFPPLELVITNTTVGAESYSWVFQEGDPKASSVQHPSNVIFNSSGEHTIVLEVSNGLETYKTEQTITVAPHIVSAFDYEVAFEDDDLQVPVTVTMQNNSVSATNYTWTFEGGNPSSNTEENPTITFSNPGTYVLKLGATNGKETKTVSKSITVVSNTNIRFFKDVHLGINTAHTSNVIGAFFSNSTREVYKKEMINSDNGAFIDISFFGLNQNFTFNKFIAPDAVQNVTFDVIPNATHTKFINVQESCDCEASMTVAAFDNITDDTLLAALTITETTEGLQEFDNSLVPRIVLFETHDGRKGAIKIKDFVNDGVDSYIIIDIKVQKE